MKEIAVYGKGGIGKSTITANLSAALADEGRRVLQIGCDPKHDSTRLLMHGQTITTALDYLRSTNPSERRIEDILFEGYGGVGCVEAGGPEPGVGCAGRGIITTFELLDSFKIKECYDTILYDVLGDVVCGGFAVPIRSEYAEAVFIVTSGEFMALYAANNILRGIRSYDGDERRRVAGIIYNSRNVRGEDERVEAFSNVVGLPIVARIPRSDSFAEAEAAGMTVVEWARDPALSALFDRLARNVIDGIALYGAEPLTDDELEQALLRRTLPASARTASPASASHVTTSDAATGGIGAVDVGTDVGRDEAPIDLVDPNRLLSKNLLRGEPLHGCAFNGAVDVAVQITDAIILAHSPTHCISLASQTITSPGRRAFYERGALMPSALSPNLVSTDMDESDMVFGGTGKLLERVREARSHHPKAIIVVSACPAGIIGDDIQRARELSDPDLPVLAIEADGNMSGDYLQGMMMSYAQLARQIIDDQVGVVARTVNIVYEKIVVKDTDANFAFVEGVLSRLDVSVNCRFLYDTTFDRLRDFRSAELNLLAYRDYTGRRLEDFLHREYGARFFEHEFPVGIDETEEWVRGLARHFDREEEGETILAEQRRRYDEEIARLRPRLAGRKLLIITYNHKLDWILRTAIDVGIEIVKLCVLSYSQDEGFRTDLTLDFPIEEDYDRDLRAEDIAYYKPDILLANYASTLSGEVAVSDTIPMCPDIGFDSGIKLVRRWAELLDLDIKEGWRDDERFYAHYFGNR